MDLIILHFNFALSLGNWRAICYVCKCSLWDVSAGFGDGDTGFQFCLTNAQMQSLVVQININQGGQTKLKS
jgi:hypothetical protein